MAIELLECTLRDGSYAINFEFTAKFTGEFCRVLDDLQFPYIEIGHGMGIGASEKIKRAAESDHSYAEAAQAGVNNSKWGMFAIPGIANKSEILQLIDQGMDFVRIGVDALELESGLDLVSELQGKNIEIFVNFMKSYALSAEVLAERMEAALAVGVDGVYLVDSAGGMLPNEIGEFADVLNQFSKSTKLGFHGHDNLGFAVANSIQLAGKGFNLIDCTMQGLGRSSGNASTEKIVSTLSRVGLLDDMDVIEVLKAGEQLIRPKIRLPGHGGLDTMAGYTLFHTSYMENLLIASEEFNVDPYVLMQEHCDETLLSGSLEQFREKANSLKRNGISATVPLPEDQYVGNEQT